MTKEAVERKKVVSGEVMTIEDYFLKNPHKIHILNNNPSRKGVIINGAMIELESTMWNAIKMTRVYHDELLGELRVLYHSRSR